MKTISLSTFVLLLTLLIGCSSQKTSNRQPSKNGRKTVVFECDSQQSVYDSAQTVGKTLSIPKRKNLDEAVGMIMANIHSFKLPKESDRSFYKRFFDGQTADQILAKYRVNRLRQSVHNYNRQIPDLVRWIKLGENVYSQLEHRKLIHVSLSPRILHQPISKQSNMNTFSVDSLIHNDGKKKITQVELKFRFHDAYTSNSEKPISVNKKVSCSIPGGSFKELKFSFPSTKFSNRKRISISAEVVSFQNETGEQFSLTEPASIPPKKYPNYLPVPPKDQLERYVRRLWDRKYQAENQLMGIPIGG